MKSPYSPAALSIARRVAQIAITGSMVRTEEQDREAYQQIATVISERTRDQEMRQLLTLIETRATDGKVSDGNFRALVGDAVTSLLDQLRADEKQRIDPETLLPKVAS